MSRPGEPSSYGRPISHPHTGQPGGLAGTRPLGRQPQRYGPVMVVESVDEVGVEASLDDPRELQTRDELRRLLVAHDLSGLQWTDRVVVESRAVPHSHPVLTLNTRHTGDDLLTTFLHEQLHWWGTAHPYWPDAVEATRPSWPSVPESVEGGAKDERSTREHLLLCSLEHRALRAVVGESRCRDVETSDG